jgi:hypothetical protein
MYLIDERGGAAPGIGRGEYQPITAAYVDILSRYTGLKNAELLAIADNLRVITLELMDGAVYSISFSTGEGDETYSVAKEIRVILRLNEGSLQSFFFRFDVHEVREEEVQALALKLEDMHLTSSSLWDRGNPIFVHHERPKGPGLLLLIQSKGLLGFTRAEWAPLIAQVFGYLKK